MKAVMRNEHSAQNLIVSDVAEPQVRDHEVLIEIRATSVNRGELALLKVRSDGWIPGQDFAGTVLKSAADGSGPKIGTRVVGLAEGGAWSEKLAVSADRFITLSDAVSFEDAAALPMVGLTALRTLKLAPNLLGSKLLVTAGSGGVGFYQVQLACLAGAQVTAIVKDDHVARRISQLFPEVTFIEGFQKTTEKFDVILDGVGGDVLKSAIQRLRPEGTLVLFGDTSGKPTDLSIFDFMPGHENSRILTYFSYYGSRPITDDLSFLFDCLENGRLIAVDKQIFTFDRAAEGIGKFAERKLRGKLILRPTLVKAVNKPVDRVH